MLGCESGTVTVTPTATIVNNFFVTWEIDSASVGAVDCGSVGATFVTVDTVNLDTNERVVFSLPCGDFQGNAGPIGVGRFDVVVSLITPSGSVLSRVDLGAQTISEAGTFDLGHVAFAVP
jgi:hypothetical protein